MKLTALKMVAIFCLGIMLIAWKITSDIRNQSEQQLNKEKATTEFQNKLILSGKEIQEKYEKEREQAKRDREFCKSIGSNYSCLDEERKQVEKDRNQKEKDRKLCLALSKESDCLE